MKIRSIAVVCLLVMCSAVLGKEEENEIGRWLERPANFRERLEAYERLREMRRALGLKHLTPATQFEFARQRYL